MEEFLDAGKNLFGNEGTGYFIYNPGDLPTDVKIAIDCNALPAAGLKVVLKHRIQNGQLSVDPIIGQLQFKQINVSEGD
jgi:hypothetical protein